jgi:F-type H+-transporting ATPase subunit b
MVTQAYAQEAETPAESHVDTHVDAAHGDPTADTHTEVGHAEEHSDVFPPFDPSTFPSQLLWLALSFGALYLLMSRIALPRIGGILENRKALIDADLAAADASRQKTDAAIAAYESALASARSNAQTIASQTREQIQSDLAARRRAVETDLAGRVAEAEARIAATKAEALTHVDEIASETARTVVAQLVGDVSADTVRAAVAKVKE